ncbi:hypothetical protein [Paenibacillus sp. TSA_86.1]|uniref:hypothetical protein n=1 Tax=Paenibacillus sp. TSA_86.1 TaxID=3415649 RepID=UPI004046337E
MASTNYRQTIGRLSADYRQTIGRLSADYRQTIGRLSADYRQTIGRHQKDEAGLCPLRLFAYNFLLYHCFPIILRTCRITRSTHV